MDIQEYIHTFMSDDDHMPTELRKLAEKFPGWTVIQSKKSVKEWRTQRAMALREMGLLENDEIISKGRMTKKSPKPGKK